MAFRKINNEWCLTNGQGQKITTLASLVKDLPTPFYLYDLDDISERLSWFRSSAPSGLHLHYAMKANSHPAILRRIQSHGVGVDVVSIGEMERALDCRFQPAQVVFSGVGKSHDEIRKALSARVGQINVESEPEVRRIAQVAAELRCVAPIAIRLNPDVEATTHPYIRTGFRENKFGVDEADLPFLLQFIESQKATLKLQGLSLHIGSQIRDLKSFREAFGKTQRIYYELKKRFDLRTFDMGGGLGIDYAQDGSADQAIVSDYLAAVRDIWKGDPETQLLLEPGRILVARCGLLVTRVEYIKKTPYKNFAIVDTGMHQLMRPALYQAYHRIENIAETKSGTPTVYDIVGPICESSDTLGHDRSLNTLTEGETLLILDTGAYGAVMSSNYNLHPPAKEYVIQAGQINEGR
jgi:diaminopimelate decarboxylase